MRGILTKTWLLVTAGLAVFGLFPGVLSANEDTTAPIWEDTTYLGRAYDESFDLMFDDFVRDNVDIAVIDSNIETITVTGDVTFDEHTPYYSVNYTDAHGNTADDAIFKGASGVNETAWTFDYVVMDIRGTNEASIEDLAILFRMDDTHKLLRVPFSNLVLGNADEVAEFDGTFQRYVIDLMSTLDGLRFSSGSAADITDGDDENGVETGTKLVGLHLVSTSGAGTIDIKRDVLWSNEGTVPDTAVISDTYPAFVQYWGGSVGQLIEKWLIVGQDGAYSASAFAEMANADGAFGSFVLRAKGAGLASEVSITPIFASGETGETKTLDTLVGPDEVALPTLTENFQNLVIGLEANGWATDVIGFTISNSSASNLFVDQIFFTNMEILPPVKDFPILDNENVLVYDNFNRTSVGATPQYDNQNPVALNNGFSYIIDYSQSGGLSIENEALAVTQGTGAYQSYAVHSATKFNLNEYRYLVLKTQLTLEATYDNFRMLTKTSGDTNSATIYANDWLAATGLKSIPVDTAEYAYQSGDWTYLVIDLIATGYGTDVAGFELYYSGAGKLLIDSTFFANPVTFSPYENETFLIDDYEREVFIDGRAESLHWAGAEGTAENISIVDGALKLDGSAFVQAAMGIKSKDNRYLQMDIKGDEGSSLSTLRLGLPDASVWWKDGLLVDQNGIKAADVTTEFQTYVFDLTVAGFELGDTLRIALDGDNVLYFDNLTFIKEFKADWNKNFLIDDYERSAYATSPENEVASLYWANAEGTAENISIVDGALKLDGSAFVQVAMGIKASGYRYLMVDIKGDEGSSLSTLRLGLPDASVWWKDGLLVDQNGIKAADVTTEFQTYVFDLTVAGFELGDTLRIALDGDNVLYFDNLTFVAGVAASVVGFDKATSILPTVTLNVGLDTIAVGSTWKDAGVTSTGTLTVKGDEVNTAVVGSYVVIYEVANEFGVVVSVSRVVSVVAVKDIVVFKLNAGLDSLKVGETFVDGGVSVTVNGNASTATVNSTVDTAIAGTYRVTYSVVVNSVTYTHVRFVTVY